MLGNWEIILIVLAIFILFGGGKKIPELFSGLGKGIRSFRKSLSGDEEDESKKSQIDSENKQS